MTIQVIDNRVKLKEPTGWFAAGATFRRALLTLSDGAFKLFAYICVETDRQTGRFETTQRELARVLGKSRRSVGSYSTELETNGICRIHTGANQFARTVFEITEEYWPYQSRVSDPLPAAQETTYVQAVRKMFLSIACTSSKFTNSDARVASQMQIDGVPLSVVQDAILLGACRKYIAWLNRSSAEPIVPIGSLRYFTPIVAELCRRPLPLGYREHLQIHNARYGSRWKTATGSNSAPYGGYPDMASTEIVQ
jgi:hypothetical protein